MIKKFPKDFKFTPYWEQDVKLRVEIIGERLCFSTGGWDDLQIIPNRDGHIEVAFLTNLDNMTEIAKKILRRIKEVKKYNEKRRKEGVKDESGQVLARGRKSRGSEKANKHCPD